MTRLTKLRVRCSKARRTIRRLAASRRRGWLVEVGYHVAVREHDGARLVADCTVAPNGGTLLVDRRGRIVDDARIERMMDDVGAYCSALMRERPDA